MVGRAEIVSGSGVWGLLIILAIGIGGGLNARSQVVISEVLSHSDPPWEDAIELQNTGSTEVDISHWWLSDSTSTPNRYRIPPGTVLSPGGFAVFYQYQFGGGTGGFSLNSSAGDRVVLTPADSTGIPTGPAVSVSFGPLKNAVSAGRHVTSASVDLVPLSRRTFGREDAGSVSEFRLGTGLSNAPPRVGPLVVSEIHFAPLDAGGSSSTDDEFIELQNIEAVPVSLFDPAYPTNTWRLAEGITFSFPFNVTLPAGGLVILVGFDPVSAPGTLAVFRSRFAVPAGVLVLGPFSGRLSNSGEAVALLWPDEPEGPDDPDAGYVPYEQVDRVLYSDRAPWPREARESGLSLQRRTLLDYGNEPQNWFAAIPTPGRTNQEDTDTDGMPDAWEWTRSFDPRNAADASQDPDLDGLSNFEEYVAGTEPRDAFSTLRIESVRVEGGRLELRFLGQAGRGYVIQTRDSTVISDWIDADVIPPLATGGNFERSIPLSPSASSLVRIKVDLAR